MPSRNDRCCGVESLFDEKLAHRDLRTYRETGPSASTQQLLAALRATDRPMKSLLDIGGGVGTIAHELLENGVERATLVDASASYVAAARDEATRRATVDRLEIRLGDFVEIATGLPSVDVVTLDKVVCCYPDMHALLAVSAALARRLYGIVYPRDSWWVHLAIAIENRVRRLRGGTFQGFVHSNAAIDAALRRQGLRLCTQTRGAWWIVGVYERSADVPGRTR